jgi:hypothetical protein
VSIAADYPLTEGVFTLEVTGANAYDKLFEVRLPIGGYYETVETGAPGWTHAIVNPGFVDQWHISTELNHTPNGGHSWKCGDTGTGTYANLLDAGLVSTEFELAGTGELRYWQWIDSEVSSAYPGKAYDGGLVEMSVDGGPFTQITPVGGYPYTIRAGSNPGPFPADTPVFSGTQDWHQVTFDLTGVSGSVVLRFRFGTDGADAREGWYVDDIVVDGFVIDSSPVADGTAGALRFALQGSRTNPTMGSAQIAFEVPTSAAVHLAVFDVSGRLIRTLAQETFGPGAHTVVWDGTDGNGSRVSSGVYYCRMQSSGFSATRPVVMSR